MENKEVARTKPGDDKTLYYLPDFSIQSLRGSLVLMYNPIGRIVYTVDKEDAQSILDSHNNVNNWIKIDPQSEHYKLIWYKHMHTPVRPPADYFAKLRQSAGLPAKANESFEQFYQLAAKASKATN